MKKGDIQQQISDEQCTAIHNYSKFSFGFGNTRVLPKKKITKYGMYAMYTVLWACMHMHKDKHNNRLVIILHVSLTSISCILFSLDEDEDNLPVDIITEVNKFHI